MASKENVVKDVEQSLTAPQSSSSNINLYVVNLYTNDESVEVDLGNIDLWDEQPSELPIPGPPKGPNDDPVESAAKRLKPEVKWASKEKLDNLARLKRLLKAEEDGIEELDKKIVEAEERLKRAKKKSQDWALCLKYQRKVDENIMKTKLNALMDEKDDDMYVKVNVLHQVEATLRGMVAFIEKGLALAKESDAEEGIPEEANKVKGAQAKASMEDIKEETVKKEFIKEEDIKVEDD